MKYCPAPVEQEKFPTENSGYKLTFATPCTDGATLFIPKGSGQEGFLFHELGHFLMHYPNGPDPNLLDPDIRYKSKWEAEACLFGRLVCVALDLDPGYNDTFLWGWRGDASRIDYATVYQKAAEIIAHYRTHAKTEDFDERVFHYVPVSEGWGEELFLNYDGTGQGALFGDSLEPGYTGGEVTAETEVPRIGGADRGNRSPFSWLPKRK